MDVKLGNPRPCKFSPSKIIPYFRIIRYSGVIIALIMSHTVFVGLFGTFLKLPSSGSFEGPSEKLISDNEGGLILGVELLRP